MIALCVLVPLASTYLYKDIYLQKCNDILKDRTKFKRISRYPIENLKKKLNKLISVVNAVICVFQPGYFYGYVKNHKEGNPLGPIIFQIHTPSYHVAKRLHDIISPYIPKTYSLRSTEESVDILRVDKTDGILTQNLFTEIPAIRTINIIFDYVYHNSDIPSPHIPESTLKELLFTCITEIPFRCTEGNLYVQQNGVEMGVIIRCPLR
ncbi:uncharacterized protein LOC143035610 [Oratosquilla oratoria]|uniref:uncharacterized protein LOC143035610 n=1 Tax=Oratosquilla oratoria TaxID=337810 RepID=UPI003F770EB0